MLADRRTDGRLSEQICSCNVETQLNETNLLKPVSSLYRWFGVSVTVISQHSLVYAVNTKGVNSVVTFVTHFWEPVL